MLKRIDFLYHFTNDSGALLKILTEGFKTSYARETLAGKNVLVPMISFSNILLRDVGVQEVLNYGNYALCLTREWGIANNINPVVYTYEEGQVDNSLNGFLLNSIFLSTIQDYKENLKKYSDNKLGPLSKSLSLTNTPKEVMDILDHLSMHYDENLLDIIANYSKKIYEANMLILRLTKQYKVTNVKGKEFVAYNDREWRKLFTDLPIHFEDSMEYKKWIKTPKPHFDEQKYRLNFNVEDIKAILVKDAGEIDEVTKALKQTYGDKAVTDQIYKRSLIVGTKKELESENF